ncbi:MarR family transcriptional regulator [Kocuria sp.]|jgi:DNA-binding MarR family transcriptional regulator|uniref:MarR family winged helix-turn-helix transcriptional regulator n=1 Tax=Kocuria sp. TaxID=1871328 RepID=UPI002811550E|nr:MarR family transcriptional regulator [Kocuria sp.]HST71140.1 MarR family transcriptional regulator [Kocuria rosea]
MTAQPPAFTARDDSPPGGIERLAGTDLAGESFFLMARLASTGSAAANRALADLGLKVRHYSVLALACSGEEPTQRELSQFLVLDPSQIVSIIDELEQRGAVERRTDPRDRRSKIVAPTGAGRELYAEAQGLVAAAAAESLDGLSVAERQDLLRLLQKAAL